MPTTAETVTIELPPNCTVEQVRDGMAALIARGYIRVQDLCALPLDEQAAAFVGTSHASLVTERGWVIGVRLRADGPTTWVIEVMRQCPWDALTAPPTAPVQ